MGFEIKIIDEMMASLEVLNNADNQPKTLDELYPAKKGAAKTSTLLEKLEKLKCRITTAGFSVSEIPKLVDEVEKIASTLQERADARKDAVVDLDLDRHRSIVSDGHMQVMNYINDRLRKFG